MTLNRDEILQRIEERKTERKAVEVPAWGGTVYVRRMSSAETARLSADEVSMPARIVAACATDEEGNRIFTDADVAALMSADTESVTELFVECLRFNGMTTAEIEAAAEAFGGAQPTPSSSS